LVELKESEIAMLLKDLTDTEEALKANRAELSTAGGAPGTGKPATGKDAKKDAKAAGKPAAKGAAPVEDKNAPKPIEIEYPEDVKSEPAFMVLERDFSVHVKKNKP
jgi:hypothetical protein